MGSNNSKLSKAKVIDEYDEYRNGVMTSLQESSTSRPSSSLSKKRPVDEREGEEVVKAIGTSKNIFSLVADVTKTFGEETNVTLLRILKTLRAASYFCTGVDIILNLVVDDAVAEEINKIHEEIRDVRNDVKELERTMKWETTRIQYADICEMIVTGIEFCKQIQSNAENGSLKHDYEERLKELCSNQKLTLAMNTLLDGITGKGDFRVDILQLIYDQTNGSRPDVMRMAGRLLQLLTGGLATLLTYETLERGRQSAEQLRQAMYADRVKEAEQCYMNVIERCVDESKENMARDIDRICDEEKKLEDIAKEICNELARKYDWLQFQCLACENQNSMKRHCHGSRVEKLTFFRRSSQVIICFYTSKSAPLNSFSSAEKNQINQLIMFKRYDSPLYEYMNQTSDQRQCWATGEVIYQVYGAPQPRVLSKLYHEVSEGSYEHLSTGYSFVSIFFQN